MAVGAERYADALEVLRSAGLPAVFTQTGGMNAALEVRLDDGRVLLITDAGDSLAWERTNHLGWGVGVYPRESEYDDGPLVFDEVDDGSLDTLIPLVKRVLRQVPRSVSEN